MSLKVCKFGGTSVAEAASVARVRGIVERDADRRCVIASAPGKRHGEDQKITDLLYLCHAHASQGLGFEPVFDLVAERFRGIVGELGLDLAIEAELASVREGIARVSGDDAGRDYAASRGEYLSGRVLAAALGYVFLDAADLIFFDRRGRLHEAKTYAALDEQLGQADQASGKGGVVIPGFYGTGADGGVRTFSRGGSDITGAIVARGARADLYENWTDVTGLQMADPRIVDSPRTIDTITYRELRELAYMGATVLHDEAIFPVREAGIPVHIRNTHQPDQPGTMIVSEAAPIAHAGTITGVAGRRDFTVISIEKALMNAEIGFGRRVLDVLERHEINFEHLPSGIDTMSVVVADDQVEGKLEGVLAELRVECEPAELNVEPAMALIATVGRGMAYTPGMASRLFTALARARVNVRMIDQGSSELNIIVGVAVEDFERAVRAIHAAFVP